MIDVFLAEDFVRESNKIEGIHRNPTSPEIEVFRNFLEIETPCIGDMIELVQIFQPSNRLRDQPGLNVRVGRHIAPEGGPHIAQSLDQLLRDAHEFVKDPYNIHIAYETLHPFTDGNGRSGRALWAWGMHNWQTDPYWLNRGFLHTIYYQMLEHAQ